ncbi:MAG: hypothetical protein KA146_01520 [Leptospiraceae bacterium]|jgi:hypothetical protein|nr:hypothetical protein [Leptospiraceae bacterium]
MSEKVICVNSKCQKEFEYQSELVSGASKNIGESKGIFSKSAPKKMNTLLTCPHCKNEDYYKVTVGS